MSTNHNADQMQKVVPFVTRKTTFGERVFQLVVGVDIFDLDLGI